MNVKQLLTNTLLVATLLIGGSNFAWADGIKRTLTAQNYESATSTDWASPNGGKTLKTGDAIYGTYSQCYQGGGSGHRTCYRTVSFGYTAGTGYTTSTKEALGYVVEFDCQLTTGDASGTSGSVDQFFVPTSAASISNNGEYTGGDYVFFLSQKRGQNVAKKEEWYVNDPLNSTGSTVSLSESKWYHIKLIFTSTSVDYTITDNSTTEDVKTGSKTVAALPSIKGIWALLGRANSKLNFDNLDIYDYVDAEDFTIPAPVFAFTRVDGVNRIYSLTNNYGSGTLYYTISPAAEAPAVGNAAYTSTSLTSKSVTFSESGTYYAYVMHENGTKSSSVSSQAVTAGAITLEKPTINATNVVANGSYYSPQYTIACNNSALEGAPTATLTATYNGEEVDISSGTFTPNTIGELIVTATASGYTSSEKSFGVEYALFNKVHESPDFGTIALSVLGTTFSGATWTIAEGMTRWANWTKKAGKNADLSANTDNTDDNYHYSTVDGNFTYDTWLSVTRGNKFKYLAGYGFGTNDKGSGDVVKCDIPDAVINSIAAYTHCQNSSYTTVVQDATTTYSNPQSRALKKVIYYEPVEPTSSAIIGATGWTTFASPYALDLSSMTASTGEVKAYYASAVGGSSVTMTTTDAAIQAGEGIMLKGTPTATITIPVAASGEAITGNMLVGVTSNTTLTKETANYANFYVLSNNDGTAEFQNLKNWLDADHSVTINAGKAYLDATGATGARLSIAFDDETTGVQELKNSKIDGLQTGDCYNLRGQRVSQPTKGLYIVNGKKVIMK